MKPQTINQLHWNLFNVMPTSVFNPGNEWEENGSFYLQIILAVFCLFFVFIKTRQLSSLASREANRCAASDPEMN